MTTTRTALTASAAIALALALGGCAYDYLQHTDRVSYSAGDAVKANLEAQTIVDDQGFSATFEIDPFRKYCLLNGLDDIGLTLRHESELDAFESKHDAEFWLKPRATAA